MRIPNVNLTYAEVKNRHPILDECIGEMVVNGIDWDNWSENPDLAIIEENLINPTYCTYFTAEDSPLAKLGADGKPERFELYAGGLEIANGYSEQDDWRLQQKAFEAQGVVDTEYIDALKMGLPNTFGVGVGVDRVLMLLTGRNIREII